MIWAVTAMNEQEIEGQVGESTGLDGFSVKPLSYDQLREILIAANISFSP